MAIVNTSQGFWPVLLNRPFRRLWAAQWLAQTSQNTINFVLIVLIERITGSSMHLGLTILAFTLPGVIFAPVSGVVIDRWPKKTVLVASNLLRGVIVLSYLLVLGLAPDHSNGWVLLTLYTLTFLMSTVGQFFNPAEAAAIPLLVGRTHLMTANSLFSLTLALSQVIGLIIVGPLVVKLIGVEAAFVVIACLYGVAALLVGRLPRDEPQRNHAHPQGGWQQAKSDLREGASFVISERPVLVSMTHLTLIASLVMTLAMLAPGISTRVLHLAPEDAIVVFAPAGVGMLLAAVILGRWGNRVPKQRLVHGGLAAMALGFALFGVLAWRFQVTNQQFVFDASVMTLPVASAALILATIAMSLALGLAMATVNIVSQTLLQEHTPDRLRGRVFSVQFMLNNLVGIPPMLAIAALADLIGIPQMLIGIAGVILLVFGVTLRIQRWLAQPASARAASEADPAAVIDPSLDLPVAAGAPGGD
ncbi:MAG TPA: MFS transporter [Anaerolineae bacterium]|nr:MFS transporter [Anaerolineae bacterium]HNU05289.1 MFS transporter [Anaerolineae bacterium]